LVFHGTIFVKQPVNQLWLWDGLHQIFSSKILARFCKLIFDSLFYVLQSIIVCDAGICLEAHFYGGVGALLVHSFSVGLRNYSIWQF
jgi:hypothetical protein